MAAKLNVVTGATGLIGSHLAEQLVARGERVRALVRPTSDTAFLERLGVELVQGGLHDGEALRRLVNGADVVFHCAARVGDWGAWRLYQNEVIDATRNVLDACRAASVGRVVYFSSITVYGNPRTPGQITEDEPRGQRMRFRDHYCRSKIMAEDLAWAYGPDATVVRPGWCYGPRDRNSLPRIIKALQAGRVWLIGDGQNLLNLLYAGDVAAGAILAADNPGARGQAFNLCSEGELTQEGFLDAITDALNMPHVRRHLPFRLAYALGLLSEIIGKAIFLKRPPHITRYGVALVGRPTRFSTAKARTLLGWRPRVTAREGIRLTLEWLRAEPGSPLYQPRPAVFV
ncbi:MAG TPA: NAD-dependent epimerase/dehydratase family protein [Gemmataceae bacterium]